jgi:hypothetical protein
LNGIALIFRKEHTEGNRNQSLGVSSVWFKESIRQRNPTMIRGNWKIEIRRDNEALGYKVSIEEPIRSKEQKTYFKTYDVVDFR